MNRPILLLAVLLTMAAPLSAKQPNIVLCITDDQGYGDIGAHGHPFLKTPNIDALHANSVRLDDYHVAPTCAPTRAALYTGHWTNRTGVWHTIMGRSLIRENEITIGTLLSDSGYATGFFGKWHLGDNYPYRPEDRGFQHVLRHGGGGVGQTPDYWDNAYFDDTYWLNGTPTKTEGHCTDVFYGYGREFIEKQAQAGKPFLAIISTNAPHGPMHAPQEYADIYQDAFPDEPEETNAKGEQKGGKDRVGDRHYFGMITHIDHNVGLVRTLLEELGIEDDTIFIFTTDNGTVKSNVYDGGMRGQKSSEYEGGHRVPFFVHYPKGELTGGRQVETLTSYVDIVPTLLDYTSTAAPEGYEFDGVSIRPLLEKGDHSEWTHADRVLFTDSQRVKDPIKWRQSATMSERWRLINGKELYDIDADPMQANDIAAEHPEVVQRLTAAYDEWWEELLPTFAQTCEIPLGHPDAKSVRLTAHDYLSEGHSPWNHGHIRNAQDSPESFGPWGVNVVEAGEYEIEIRRYPREADLAIRGSAPAGAPVPGEKSNRTIPGKPILAKEAVIQIAGNEERAPVGEDDKFITFKLALPAGSTELLTKWITDEGKEVGAYYAYVTKL